MLWQRHSERRQRLGRAGRRRWQRPARAWPMQRPLASWLSVPRRPPTLPEPGSGQPCRAPRRQMPVSRLPISEPSAHAACNEMVSHAASSL